MVPILFVPIGVIPSGTVPPSKRGWRASLPFPESNWTHLGQAAIQRRNRDGLCALNGRPFGLVARRVLCPL